MRVRLGSRELSQTRKMSDCRDQLVAKETAQPYWRQHQHQPQPHHTRHDMNRRQQSSVAQRRAHSILGSYPEGLWTFVCVHKSDQASTPIALKSNQKISSCVLIKRRIVHQRQHSSLDKVNDEIFPTSMRNHLRPLLHPGHSSNLHTRQ